MLGYNARDFMTHHDRDSVRCDRLRPRMRGSGMVR